MREPRGQPAASAEREMQLGAFTWDALRRQLRLDGRVMPLRAADASVFAALAAHPNRPVPAGRLLQAADDQAPRGLGSLWESVSAINALLATGGGSACYVAHHPSDGFSLVAKVPVAGASATDARAARSRVIGRGAAVRHIAQELGKHRFVTILGPGGMGKTTVAQLLARESTTVHPDGAFLVDLSRLDDDRLVAPAVGHALGFTLSAAEPIESLAAFVQAKSLLLILDSCERLAAGAARVAEAVLAAAPALRVLATSREPLLASGERLYRLPALEAPPPGEAPALPRGGSYSAVELFVERARERDPAFAPDAAGLEEVGAICRRLDGLPLAIEIVAARAGERAQLGELSRQLDERLLRVQHAAGGTPARHHTLAAMMDWSHDQLDRSEQLALRQLSVFRGRFTLEAAEAVVAGPDDEAPVDVVRAVPDLVERSLVAQTATGAYRLLDTMRVYAATKVRADERLALATRHARYLLVVLRRAEADWLAMDARSWQREYGNWIDDVRLALAGCFGAGGDEDLGVELAAGSFELARRMSLDAEWRRYTQRALELLRRRRPRDYATELTLHAYEGTMIHLLQAQGKARPPALLDILDQEGVRLPVRVRIIAVGAVHHAALMAADFATAGRWAQQAVADGRASGDAVASMIAQRMSAQTTHFLGGHAEAEALARSVLASGRGIPLAWMPSPVEPRVSMRLLLARVHWMQGRFRSAARWCEECLWHAQSDTAIARCQALAMCAIPLALWNRDTGKASALVAELRHLAQRHALRYWLHWAERYLLVVALWTGEGSAQADPRLFDAGPATGNLRDHLCTFDPRLFGDDVSERVRSGKVGWCAPEVLRARALLALRPDDPGHALAQRLLREAVALARKQGALAWELRAATSLARLAAPGPGGGEAHAELRAVLARLAPEEETADVLQARAVLARPAPQR